MGRALSGIGLSLSGGGFRAALFHLGALRRLNELGILGSLNTISAVSGGSIIAGHLAASIEPWPESGRSFESWEKQVAQPFRLFAKRNIRTGPILSRLLPWNWGWSSGSVEWLANTYNQHLTGQLLVQMPPKPNFVFCATDMNSGTNWKFTRRSVGSYGAGSRRSNGIPVSLAVAASSSFPPFLGPLRFPLRLSTHDGFNPRSASNSRSAPKLKHIELTDGGVYDNLGLEPTWKRHEYVLVSDGGAPFAFDTDESSGSFRSILLSLNRSLKRVMRYNEIMGAQARAMRARFLINQFERRVRKGAFWSIGTDTSKFKTSQEGNFYTYDSINKISNIRTDLDAFSDDEIKILENHGYIVADAVIRRRAPSLIIRDEDLCIPHREVLSKSSVDRALVSSHKRHWLGRR